MTKCCFYFFLKLNLSEFILSLLLNIQGNRYDLFRDGALFANPKKVLAILADPDVCIRLCT